MSSETDLPHDIMLHILPYLPVKSLIRFTSVCKQWHSTILSDPKFATTQFKAARDRKTPHKLIFSTAAPLLESLDLHDKPPYGTKLTFPFEQDDETHVTLLGSCNGLVFVAVDATNFYIWNPSTRVSTQFPEPGFEDPKGLEFYGVGYVSAADDYVVFAAAYDMEEEQDAMKMFSYRAQDWKTIQHPGHESGSKATLLNETLHWISERKLILAFDLVKEEFTTIFIPHEAQEDNYEINLYPSIDGVSEGCLCLSVNGKSGGSTDFWIMREYGVFESWSKYYCFTPIEGLGLYLRFFVIEGCKVGVKKGGSGTSLLLVKLENGQEMEIGTYMHQSWWFYRSHSGFDMIQHEDSLLWLSDVTVREQRSVQATEEREDNKLILEDERVTLPMSPFKFSIADGIEETSRSIGNQVIPRDESDDDISDAADELDETDVSLLSQEAKEAKERLIRNYLSCLRDKEKRKREAVNSIEKNSKL